MLKCEKNSTTFFFPLSSQFIHKSDIFCLILIYSHYSVRKLIKEEYSNQLQHLASDKSLQYYMALYLSNIAKEKTEETYTEETECMLFSWCILYLKLSWFLMVHTKKRKLGLASNFASK